MSTSTKNKLIASVERLRGRYPDLRPASVATAVGALEMILREATACHGSCDQLDMSWKPIVSTARSMNRSPELRESAKDLEIERWRRSHSATP